MPKRIFEGTIISDKMEKTVVVKVERIKKHPKYKKRYRVYKKYKAHVEGDDFKMGDRVVIQECRPISKDKTWRVTGRPEKAQEKESPKKEVKEPAVAPTGEAEGKEVKKEETK